MAKTRARTEPVTRLQTDGDHDAPDVHRVADSAIDAGLDEIAVGDRPGERAEARSEPRVGEPNNGEAGDDAEATDDRDGPAPWCGRPRSPKVDEAGQADRRAEDDLGGDPPSPRGPRSGRRKSSAVMCVRR
jgi:hypothetical protein